MIQIDYKSSLYIIYYNIYEEVDSYVYLRKIIARDVALLPEVKRRTVLGWAVFGKFDSIMRNSKSTIKIKRKLFNEYDLPVMT